MNDCMLWFITKHWLIASVMFPGPCFVWAVWMKQTVWAVFLAFWLATNYACSIISAVGKAK
jgi:hypothetical protein